MRMTLIFALVATSIGGMAIAKPHLRTVEAINDRLFDMAVAKEVSEKCASIDGRSIKGKTFALSTYNMARNMGYSHAEIESYIKSKPEKAKLRAKGEEYLKMNGVNLNDPNSYCVFGKAEIAKESRIGSFLKAK